MAASPAISDLRRMIAAVEGGGRQAAGGVSLGEGVIDMALGAWHEIGAAGMEAETCAAPAAVAARIAASVMDRGEVVWVLRRDDLYAPGLSHLGFAAERLIQVCAASDDQALAVVEEALGTPGVAAVIGEAEAVPLTAGRRLQLACERTGALGLVLQRSPFGRKRKAERAGSAAHSRWRVGSAPSVPAPGFPGLGPYRWDLELLRCRGGRQGAWLIEEARHGPHPFTVVAPLGDRGVATQEPQRLAG